MPENKPGHGCNWDPETLSCKYACEEDLEMGIGGKEGCQFYKNGLCMQSVWEADEVEEINKMLGDYHRAHPWFG